MLFSLLSGIFLLQLAVLVWTNEAIRTVDSPYANNNSASEEFTTAESIYTTKLIEEITDNSILISPTSNQALLELVAQEESNISLPSTEEDDHFSNDTIELTTASYSSKETIDQSVITSDVVNQSDPAIADVETTSLPSSNCSSYAINRNVVDLSIGGQYRNVRHRVHSHRRHNQLPVLSGDHDTAEVESRNGSSMESGVHHFVYSLEGDYSVSLITDQDDFGASLFTVDRINELQLINDNGTLGNSSSSSGCIWVCFHFAFCVIAGLRILVVPNISHALELLKEEVAFLRECLPHSVGEYLFCSYHPI